MLSRLGGRGYCVKKDSVAYEYSEIDRYSDFDPDSDPDSDFDATENVGLE
jgi:hypothetical protein